MPDAPDMSEESAIVGSPNGRPEVPEPPFWKQFLAPCLWLIAFVPLLVVHFINMWHRPQYQYFPFVIAMVGYLIWTRAERIPDNLIGPVRRKRAYALLAIAFAMFLLGTAFFSPWFVAVGFVFAFGGTLLIVREQFHLSNAFGIWLVACLLIPLPGEIDVKLSQLLQRLTTVVSGNLLDLAWVPNIVEGTTLILATKRLGIEEACSGIVSMMAIVASCLMLAVLSNRALVHSIILVLSGIAWAAVTNVLRIVTLGIAFEKIGIDLSEGWRHDLLGLVLFSIALVLAVSTDRLLCFLLSPIESDFGEGFSKLIGAWDYVVGILNPTVESVVETRPTASELPLSMVSKPLLGLAGAFLVLGLASSAYGVVRTAAGESLAFSPKSDSIVGKLVEESLPEKIGDWRRVSFKDSHAKRLFAQESKVWIYENGEQQATFAVDFSFPAWHDLCVCYSKIDWSQNGKSILRRSDEPGGDFLASEFYQGNAAEAELLYCLVENNGAPYAPPDALTWAGEAKRRLQPDKTLYQIQLWVTERGDLSEFERKEAEELFLECRRNAMKTILEPTTKEGDK